MYRAVHISEVFSVPGKVANTVPTGSVFKSVRVVGESSHGTGVTSPARNAAGNESVADGIADTDGEGNHSDLVIVRSTRVITGAITNRDGVTNDPVHIRDDQVDGTRDGRIDDADVGDGAKRRPTGGVEDEAAAATVERSVGGVTCSSGWRREERPRRDDAALSADGLTGISSPVFRNRLPGRRGWP